MTALRHALCIKAKLTLISTFPGAIFIFITASAPNRASLGSVNGMAQLLVSITRAVGPATANSLFSLSIDKEHHYMGGHLVYYVLSALVLVAFWVGTLLPDDPSYDLEDNVKSLSSSSSSSAHSSSSSSTFSLRR